MLKSQIVRILILLISTLIALSCTEYREKFKPDITDTTPKSYLENRYYILLNNQELIGYAERYKKVQGLGEESNYVVYDKNYNKIGFIDGYGRTYLYQDNDKKEQIGTGTIIESCRMIFDLDYTKNIQLESVK